MRPYQRRSVLGIVLHECRLLQTGHHQLFEEFLGQLARNPLRVDGEIDFFRKTNELFIGRFNGHLFAKRLGKRAEDRDGPPFTTEVEFCAVGMGDHM